MQHAVSCAHEVRRRALEASGHAHAVIFPCAEHPGLQSRREFMARAAHVKVTRNLATHPPARSTRSAWS